LTTRVELTEVVALDVQVEVGLGATGSAALVIVMVFLSLYVPGIFVAAAGETSIVQLDPWRLDENVLPFWGTLSLPAVPVLLSDTDHFPEVVTVSVPPRLSLQPLNVGGALSGALRPSAGVLPFAVTLVHVTVIPMPSIVPTAVKLVPNLSLAVMRVLAGTMCGTAAGAADAADAIVGMPTPRPTALAMEATAAILIVRESMSVVSSPVSEQISLECDD
jgi:hypothetical protein